MPFIIFCFVCAIILIISIFRENYKNRKRYNDTFKRYEEFLKTKNKNCYE